jgi:hypothetical protein
LVMFIGRVSQTSTNRLLKRTTTRLSENTIF